jgi:hypothetical protein
LVRNVFLNGVSHNPGNRDLLAFGDVLDGFVQFSRKGNRGARLRALLVFSLVPFAGFHIELPADAPRYTAAVRTASSGFPVPLSLSKGFCYFDNQDTIAILKSDEEGDADRSRTR